MRVKHVLLFALPLLLTVTSVHSAAPRISLTPSQAVANYWRFYDDYLHDEGSKVAQYRELYAGIRGSLADRIIERAIWYMENGYMVYGHYYPQGYFHYGIVDCSNFTKLVYGDFSINITGTAKQYDTVGSRVEGVYPVKNGSFWEVKGTQNLRPGDIMTWYNTDAEGRKYISHVAIFMGMLHGQPAVIGTRSDNPTAIGIVNSFKYWWGSHLFSVRRVLPSGAWDPAGHFKAYDDGVVVTPESYVLQPQRPIRQPGQERVTVQPGDTMWYISQRTGMSLHELETRNPQVTNIALVYPGQELNI